MKTQDVAMKFPEWYNLIIVQTCLCMLQLAPVTISIH